MPRISRRRVASQTVRAPAGTFHNCLKSKETTPLEPDLLEYKFYAPGVDPRNWRNPLLTYCRSDPLEIDRPGKSKYSLFVETLAQWLVPNH